MNPLLQALGVSGGGPPGIEGMEDSMLGNPVTASLQAALQIAQAALQAQPPPMPMLPPQMPAMPPGPPPGGPGMPPNMLAGMANGGGGMPY